MARNADYNRDVDKAVQCLEQVILAEGYDDFKEITKLNRQPISVDRTNTKKLFSYKSVGIISQIFRYIKKYDSLPFGSLKTVQDVEQIFGYRRLGLIPADKKRTKYSGDNNRWLTTLKIAVRDTPQSVTSEMSRSTQANLRLLSSEKQLKTITITSSVANEGKSKVAANLAAAIASVGQKVLLIDADMRVPYQHQFWKVPLKKGLSDILSEKSKLNQICWTVMDNLDLLTAGSRPHNPLSCIESTQMKSLLQEVSALYDFVIIDTPPLLAAADTLSVGNITDGILLVARPGVIKASNALAARDQLKMVNANILGLIVNGVIARYETEDYFSAVNDYMDRLGKTIIDNAQSESIFTDTEVESTRFLN